MKRILIILMLFAVGLADSPKKFEVTYTVKYNAITLEEAAKKEMVFRELYKDACIVDIRVKESQGGTLTAVTHGGGITFTDDTDLDY